MVAGFAVQKADEDDWKRAFPIVLSATIAGFLAIYFPGVIFMKKNLNLTFGEAISRGFVPFLIADAIKIAAVVPITLKLRPIIRRYLSPDA
nr:biotin transporter BioY [Brucepastera parasyntrophica]